MHGLGEDLLMSILHVLCSSWIKHGLGMLVRGIRTWCSLAQLNLVEFHSLELINYGSDGDILYLAKS